MHKSSDVQVLKVQAVCLVVFISVVSLAHSRNPRESLVLALYLIPFFDFWTAALVAIKLQICDVKVVMCPVGNDLE